MVTPHTDQSDNMRLMQHLRERAASLPGFLAIYLWGVASLTIIGLIFTLVLVPTLVLALVLAPAWHFLNRAPINLQLKAALYGVWYWVTIAILVAFFEPIVWYVTTTAAWLDSSVLVLWDAGGLLGVNLSQGERIMTVLSATALWALLHGLIGLLGISLIATFFLWLKIEA